MVPAYLQLFINNWSTCSWWKVHVVFFVVTGSMDISRGRGKGVSKEVV